MAINLSKGQKVDLTKGNPGLKNIMVGLGWDVNAFDAGADDFITNPFGIMEFISRVKAVLRRSFRKPATRFISSEGLLRKIFVSLFIQNVPSSTRNDST